jgi:hypothetical protein
MEVKSTPETSYVSNICQTADNVQYSVSIPEDHLLNSINLCERLFMEKLLILRFAGTPAEERKQPRIM